MGAIEVIWPRLVPGGLVLLDDYGWEPHSYQKKAWDELAARDGVMILFLPTGQGLIINS
jgi:O-methyltransferase